MTKGELVSKMAQDAGISKASAKLALDSFMDSVKTSLKKKNGRLTIVGFGTFYKVRRKARNGRNPRTGEIIRIKASDVVRFRPGKDLREAIK
nr:HU family DNA-binding protein [Desulfobacterales bacterium]